MDLEDLLNPLTPGPVNPVFVIIYAKILISDQNPPFFKFLKKGGLDLSINLDKEKQKNLILNFLEGEQRYTDWYVVDGYSERIKSPQMYFWVAINISGENDLSNEDFMFLFKERIKALSKNLEYLDVDASTNQFSLIRDTSSILPVNILRYLVSMEKQSTFLISNFSEDVLLNIKKTSPFIPKQYLYSFLDEEDVFYGKFSLLAREISSTKKELNNLLHNFLQEKQEKLGQGSIRVLIFVLQFLKERKTKK